MKWRPQSFPLRQVLGQVHVHAANTSVSDDVCAHMASDCVFYCGPAVCWSQALHWPAARGTRNLIFNSLRRIRDHPRHGAWAAPVPPVPQPLSLRLPFLVPIPGHRGSRKISQCWLVQNFPFFKSATSAGQIKGM